MSDLKRIKNVDIYLLDQFFKGNLNSNQRVLDAGFGKGRNLRFCIQEGMDVKGIDPNPDYVQILSAEFPELSANIIHSSIEDFIDTEGFDFIICNAVLHFAKDHKHFDRLIMKLSSLLREDGVLFVRMTSDIGIEEEIEENDTGVHVIPDQSTRYLLTREKITEILAVNKMELLEPVKTVNVEDIRCMTTLVLKK